MSDVDAEIQWGDTDLSSLSATVDGECIHFVYNNTLTSSVLYQPLVFEGHEASVVFGDGWSPDLFIVKPLEGWELMKSASILVQESTSAIITACQMFLG